MPLPPTIPSVYFMEARGTAEDCGAWHHPPHYHPMKTHPIEAGAVAVVAVGRLVRAVAVPCVALVLTVAGYRPTAAAPAAPATVPVPLLVDPAGILPAGFESVAPVAAAQAALTVVQLRQMARAAGFRGLARNGRRADLLAALALA